MLDIPEQEDVTLKLFTHFSRLTEKIVTVYISVKSYIKSYSAFFTLFLTLSLFSGVSFADVMAPSLTSKTTDEGWYAQVMTEHEHIQQINNIASSSYSTEAFVSVDAQAAITKVAGYNPLTLRLAQLTVGYQIGCNKDMSSGFELAGSIDGGLKGHDMVGTNELGIPILPALRGGIDPKGNLAGAIQGMFRPGAIVDIPLDQISLYINRFGGIGKLSLTGIHIKLDSCGGPVKMRSYAVLRGETLDEHFIVVTYGHIYVFGKPHPDSAVHP